MNIDNLISHLGTTVTHKIISTEDPIYEGDTVYGTPLETFSAGTSIKTILTAAEYNDKLVKQGILEIGDLNAAVRSDLTIAEGDVFTINGTDWQVVHVTPFKYISDVAYKTAGLKKRLAGPA